MKNEILFSQMIQLFLMIIMGYLLCKVKLMTDDFNKKLTRFLIEFTMPMLIISSVLNPEERQGTDVIGGVFAACGVLCITLPVVSVLLIKILPFPKEQQGVYMFMFTYSNIGFMGFPILAVLYGERAVLYTAILNIFVTLSTFSFGVAMMLYHGENEQSGQNGLKYLLNWKQILSPGIIGSIAAVFLYFLPVTFPEELAGAVRSVGNLTSPLAMLMTGATLAGMSFKEVFSDWHVYLFTVLKQMLFPMLCWQILKFFITDSFLGEVLFVLLLMPVANTAVLFAAKYQADNKLAAKTVFVTTVSSLFFIPCCFMLAGI